MAPLSKSIYDELRSIDLSFDLTWKGRHLVLALLASKYYNCSKRFYNCPINWQSLNRNIKVQLYVTESSIID